MLVADAEVVPRRRIGRIQVDGALPSIDRFPPQPLLGHSDTELDLRLRVRLAIGRGRRSGRNTQHNRRGQPAEWCRSGPRSSGHG